MTAISVPPLPPVGRRVRLAVTVPQCGQSDAVTRPAAGSRCCGRRSGRCPCRSGRLAPRRGARGGRRSGRAGRSPASTRSGRSRSASTAPHVPAPFSGSVRPRICGWTRPIAANSSQMVAERALAPGELEQHGRPGILDLVHRVSEPGDEAAPPPSPARRAPAASSSHPASSSGPGRPLGEGLGEEPGRVLGDPEEPRAPAEQPGGEGALQRLRGARVGHPGGDRRRREAVVGERDEHRLEHRQLPRRRAALGDEPERQLAERDLADQFARRGRGRGA